MSTCLPQKRDSRSLLWVMISGDAAESDAPEAGATTTTHQRTTAGTSARGTESMQRPHTCGCCHMPPARGGVATVHEALRPGWGSLPRARTSTRRVHGDALDGPRFAAIAPSGGWVYEQDFLSAECRGVPYHRDECEQRKCRGQEELPRTLQDGARGVRHPGEGAEQLHRAQGKGEARLPSRRARPGEVLQVGRHVRLPRLVEHHDVLVAPAGEALAE